jgi:hypothetical protein
MNIQKKIIGRYELYHGVKVLDAKYYKDVFMHFAGAETSSAESMFNLDLCYELDIGTVANQSEVC